MHPLFATEAPCLAADVHPLPAAEAPLLLIESVILALRSGRFLRFCIHQEVATLSVSQHSIAFCRVWKLLEDTRQSVNVYHHKDTLLIVRCVLSFLLEIVYLRQ